jgi:hypothetical protein
VQQKKFDKAWHPATEHSKDKLGVLDQVEHDKSDNEHDHEQRDAQDQENALAARIPFAKRNVRQKHNPAHGAKAKPANVRPVVDLFTAWFFVSNRETWLPLCNARMEACRP